MAPKRKSEAISDDELDLSAEVTAPTPIDVPPAAGDTIFVPPSIISASLLDGGSYTYHSPLPASLKAESESSSNESSENVAPVPCVLGVDEAGRGPVLGPMVYGVAYLPLDQHRSLLADEYHFDDSKVLTTAFRSHLLEQWCTPSTSLHAAAGWAVRLLSARDISAGMLRPKDVSGYNLNQQALDATVALIRETMARGVNVAEVYVDTVGQPDAYRKKLEREFPQLTITVAKKADSLYPCVSAASVAAKVTRDAALEFLWRELGDAEEKEEAVKADKTIDSNANHEEDNEPADEGNANEGEEDEDVVKIKGPSSPAKKKLKPSPSAPASSLISKTRTKKKATSKDHLSAHANQAWGSGYPSDARCLSWLRSSIHPLFGWGAEFFRFSWGGAARELLEEKGQVKVQWRETEEEQEGNENISKFFVTGAGLGTGSAGKGGGSGELSGADGYAMVDDTDDLLDEGKYKSLSSWFGVPVPAS